MVCWDPYYYLMVLPHPPWLRVLHHSRSPCICQGTRIALALERWGKEKKKKKKITRPLERGRSIKPFLFNCMKLIRIEWERIRKITGHWFNIFSSFLKLLLFGLCFLISSFFFFLSFFSLFSFFFFKIISVFCRKTCGTVEKYPRVIRANIFSSVLSYFNFNRFIILCLFITIVTRCNVISNNEIINE